MDRAAILAFAIVVKLSCAAAFSTLAPSFMELKSGRSSICAPLSLAIGSSALFGRRSVSMNQMGAGTADWTDVPDGQKPFQATERTVEQWIEKFKDSRNSMRTMAAKMVAAMHEEEGREAEIVAQLMVMMTVENMDERRTAVQCLGMIGEKVLKDVTDMMLSTEDMVVRASCAKVIGAVALKNPEMVPDFPQYSLDAMKKAALEVTLLRRQQCSFLQVFLL